MGGGAALAAWWQSQDPFPATATNERIVEHLERVEDALRAYSAPGTPEGYDGRGDLLVRFGQPSQVRQVRFNDAALLFALGRSGAGVRISDFPRNEIWIYNDIGEGQWHMLVERGGVFRTSRSQHMLPIGLRNRAARGAREQLLRDIGLLAMRSIYRQLSSLSPEYGRAWSDVSAVLDGAASPFSNVGSAAGNIQRYVEVQELERVRRQEAQEPSSVSRVIDEVPRVPYAAGAARFRAADGATRIALTWQFDFSSAELQDGEHELVGSVVNDPQLATREVVDSRVQVLASTHGAGYDGAVPVTASATCRRGPCSTSIQLDLYRSMGAEAEGAPRALVGSSVWHVSIIEPLAKDGLVLSDLQPFDASLGEPYVLPVVHPGTPISVYFEVYGLSEGADSSAINIEYDVVARRRGSLLRRRREDITSKSVRLRTRGTTTGQYVILETSDWEGADEVEVHIRVRDELVGTTAERSRTFDVASPAR